MAAAARPDGATVVLDDGTRLEADRVAWACGAWLPRLFGDLVRLRVTQQDVFFLGAGAAWATPGVPGWVDYDGAAYGLGDLDGRGVKIAPDVEGPEVDAETLRRVPRPEHEARMRAYVAARFPALADAPLVGTRTCQYELTADTRFLLAPHPEHDGRVWLLGGGSGHGFKHGPALAELVERWLAGAEPAGPALRARRPPHGRGAAHGGRRRAGPALGRRREGAVEAEGEVVRDARAGQLLERARVEDEQRGGAAARLEQDREQDAVVLLRRARALGQDRLARVRVPGSRHVRCSPVVTSVATRRSNHPPSSGAPTPHTRR